jgi:hypothetical protein
VEVDPLPDAHQSKRGANPMTTTGPSLEEDAIQDADLAARAIDYAARHPQRLRGSTVGRHFYETFGKGSGEWDALCSAFIANAKMETWFGIKQQFGDEAMIRANVEYRRAFMPAFERALRSLGQARYDHFGPVNEFDDALVPWLQLLDELEPKPSLLRRLFG